MRVPSFGALLQLLLLCLIARRFDARSLQRSSTEVQRFRIAHINDVHNRIEQASSSLSPCSDNDATGKCVGGYGRISTAIRGFRRAAQQQKTSFYFLNAGDEFLGTLWDQLYKGQATAQLQRTIASVRPSAQVLGNHEFDFGPDKLTEYLENVKHRFAVCNVNASAVPKLARQLRPFRWLAHPALKIAVVGWTTPDTAFLSSPGPVTFSPIIESLEPVIKELKKRKADVIIGLSHAGYDADLQVAAAVPELDLIVGGHSHTFLANSGSVPVVDTSTNATDTPVGPYPTYVNVTTSQSTQKRIPVVQAYYGSKYIGLLELTWSKAAGLQVEDGSGPVLLGSSGSSNPVGQDPAVAALIAPLKPAVDALQTQVIGVVGVELDGARENVRSRETNLGNLVADSMLQSIKQLPGFESQFGETFIAVQNGGGVRASIAAGNVTLGAVITVLPFGNVVSVVKVNGSAVTQAIQNGLQGWPGQGRFAQVSGLRYFHNNGTFLSAFLLKNDTQMPIDPAVNYNVVTNNFMAAGGDFYASLQAGQQVYPLGPPQDQVLAATFTSSPTGVVVAPEVEGRIINCGIINCSTEQRNFVKAGCSCA